MQRTSMSEFYAEVKRRESAKRDFGVNTEVLTLRSEPGSSVLEWPGFEPFGVQATAHDQIGARLEIPSKFYDRMLKDHPDVLDYAVNTLFRAKPESRLIRTLDGRTRAFLSDRYKPIDNFETLSAIMPTIYERGNDLQIFSNELTESRMYVKVVSRSITHSFGDDKIHAGFILQNSEVGKASVSVKPFVFREVCSNGLQVDILKTSAYHVGKRLEYDDAAELFKRETHEADTHAFLLKIRDVVTAMFEPETFRAVADKIDAAREFQIKPSETPKVLEVVGKTLSIHQYEQAAILDHIMNDGNFSMWGVVNGITRYAQDVGTIDRQNELEERAGALLQDSTMSTIRRAIAA